MSEDFLEITCPDCRTILIVRRRDGKILETRQPLLEDSSGDRFEDAYERVKRSTGELERKVEEARAREKNKMERLDALFKEGLDRAREEGPIKKPDRDLDLD